MSGERDPYAPAADVEHIDPALLDEARRKIAVAAYVLTDKPIIQALTRAADRSVMLRLLIYKVKSNR
jgi:phosphatidylserine/phosphatidylglycerophosphate/cardiolipin synthase-like enzyme